MSRVINLGAVTAYADAVEAGYTGTREEFAQDLANAATYAATSAAAKIDAEAAAETATTKAGEAATSAGSAADDADDAHSDALAALSYKEAAETAAGTATTKAGEAANSASTANTKAGEAAASATAASGSAGAASTSAGQASTSAGTATTQALKSEGYAVGKQNGTDVAEGSDYYHNNAKYYSEQAAAQLPLVTAEGTRQIGLVDAKGDEVLESIPADYTTLSNDVDDLKSDLTQVTESAIVNTDIVSNWALGNLSTSTGEPTSTQLTIYTPDYYLVNANTNITFSGVTENRVQSAYFYDKDKTFISPRSTAKPYAVPSDAVYVRFVYGFTQASGITVESYGGVNSVADDWNVTCVSAVRNAIDDKITDALASAKMPVWKTGGYITTGTTPVFDETYTTLNCMCLNVAAGEQYIVSANASLSYLPWVLTDGNLIITRAATESSADDTTLTIAAGEAKLFINNAATNTGAKVYHLHADGALSELRGDVDDLQKLPGSIATLETVGNVCPFRTNGGSSNSVELTALNNNAYRIVGTATAYTTFSVFNDATSFPDGMSAGKTYRMLFSTPNLGVTIVLNYYDNEGNSQSIGAFSKDSDFSIPSGALGFRMRLAITNGTACNYIIRPQIYAYETLSGARTIKNKNAQPMLSIIYDDGKSLFKDYILPIIESKNVPIATAIMPESIGSVNYLMTWTDVQDCYSRGAEILEHVITHTDTEWNAMGTQAISKLYLSSRNAIFAHGIHTPNVFVFAGASANHAVCRYAAMRIFKGAFNAGGGAINQYGNIDPYSINRYATDSMTLEQLKGLIDDLVTAGTGWMVWTRHNDSETVAQNAQDLADAIDYALSKGVSIVTTERGLSEYLDM